MHCGERKWHVIFPVEPRPRIPICTSGRRSVTRTITGFYSYQQRPFSSVNKQCFRCTASGRGLPFSGVKFPVVLKDDSVKSNETICFRPFLRQGDTRLNWAKEAKDQNFGIRTSDSSTYLSLNQRVAWMCVSTKDTAWGQPEGWRWGGGWDAERNGFCHPDFGKIKSNVNRWNLKIIRYATVWMAR